MITGYPQRDIAALPGRYCRWCGRHISRERQGSFCKDEHAIKLTNTLEQRKRWPEVECPYNLPTITDRGTAILLANRNRTGHAYFFCRCKAYHVGQAGKLAPR